jgi:hypothetical protein
MRKEDSRDPWIDPSHTPTAAWEKSLRPAKSSGNLTWLLIGALAVALVAFLAFDRWRDSGIFSTLTKPQVAPVASPDAKASTSRQNERPTPPVEPSPLRTQRFAKCTSAAGATTYSDRPCPSGMQAGEVSVRPDLNLADGMSEDARRASMDNNSAIAQSVVEHERRVAMNVDAPASECPYLKALIASIDAAARQPQPASEQDRLKDQRRRARDQQFALRCS